MYTLRHEKPNITLICQACLSTNRKLFVLGEYKDIYNKLFTQKESSKVNLCWECVAILKKIKNFTKRVKNAQKILNKIYVKGEDSTALNSLSTLITKVIYNEDTEVTHIEPLVEVKQELKTDDYDDDYIDDSYLIKTEIQVNKKEEVDKEQGNEDVKITKIKCKQRYKLKYKYVYNSDVNKKLKKRLAINCNDLKLWLERERDNEFFKKNKFKCFSCVSAWSRNHGLNEHRRHYHLESSGAFVCDICDSRFPTKSKLSKHVADHYFAYQCTLCSYTCYSTSHIRMHVKLHKRAVRCMMCDDVFPTRSAFSEHYNSRHRNVFVCDYCGKQCRTKYLVEKHIRTFHMFLECKVCNKRFNCRGSLRSHTWIKHSITSEAAYCPPCNKQFANVSLYKRHINTSVAHQNERNSSSGKKILCPECGNSYSRRAYMMNHYRHVHMKQSKHYCAECDKYFLNRTRFLDHQKRLHEGVKKEKNKLCNICGRGFAENRTLVNHIRTHSGERPFECEYCGAKFTQKYAMFSHVQYVHLKVKRKGCWRQ